MRILILDDNPDNHNSAFDEYVQQVGESLERTGHEVKRLTLRQMDVRSCTGCFSCWLKTPGECIITDDAGAICREYSRCCLADGYDCRCRYDLVGRFSRNWWGHSKRACPNNNPAKIRVLVRVGLIIRCYEIASLAKIKTYGFEGTTLTNQLTNESQICIK